MISPSPIVVWFHVLWVRVNQSKSNYSSCTTWALLNIKNQRNHWCPFISSLWLIVNCAWQNGGSESGTIASDRMKSTTERCFIMYLKLTEWLKAEQNSYILVTCDSLSFVILTFNITITFYIWPHFSDKDKFKKAELSPRLCWRYDLTQPVDRITVSKEFTALDSVPIQSNHKMLVFWIMQPIVLWVRFQLSLWKSHTDYFFFSRMDWF